MSADGMTEDYLQMAAAVTGDSGWSGVAVNRWVVLTIGP